MSSYPPYSNNTGAATGKMMKKPTLTRVGQTVKKSHLKSRMKADDSKKVLMSDSKLGTGISNK